MQIGMIGLGRMGSNMVRRLMAAGHECVVRDVSADAVTALARKGAVGSTSLDDFLARLATPRIVWLMVPAGIVDATLDELVPRLAPGDVVVDGGNSYYRDDIDRALRLAARKIHYVDCGTSGGVWGRERGYCLMIGGEPDVVRRLDPLFAALAPGAGTIARTSDGTAGRHGCYPLRADRRRTLREDGAQRHRVRAHGGVCRASTSPARERREESHATDAETTPLRTPEYYQYDLDLADVAEVWRRGSVVASWLLDLIATALAGDPTLERFTGRVSDSGEGRWTLDAAIDEAVPAHVLAAALFERFSSRGEAEFQDRLLSAMRFEFGGHVEKGASK
jgi:6-phosphogluconate dehydrogenase